ncbi:MAG TPA: glycosyltransferase family 39 protein [Candidatus Binatia bacterium]|nr:glycosyltransferase family 39 protein [Candidatus Binatia bacterium]
MQPKNNLPATSTERYWFWALAAFCCFMVFQNLGAAHLFEPDEGRNAERARELLLLNNWAIPHENFLPALDKTIFLYWLIAIAYKCFGVSEWSARLPSALAALGCLLLVYRFACDRWGNWVALWSTLILLTNIQFFFYSRLVIFDMTLAFFTTLALIEYHQALETGDPHARPRHIALMSAAMGLATLVKGPIGVVLPGMVIFFYMLFRRDWSFLTWRNLLLGGLVFCAIVVPWAWWTETRHAGYLRYFFLEENFLRFLTPHFRRTEPWYYYILVVACGFFPWSLFLPFAVKDSWSKTLAKENLFLILWIVVPILFFSASNSKLPHYILPIFPALSIITARSIKAISADPASKRLWTLSLPWLVWLFLICYFVIGAHWPSLLPQEIRETITQMSSFQRSVNVVLIFVLALYTFGAGRCLWKKQRTIYLSHCLGMALVLLFIAVTLAAASQTRSAKTLAERASPYIRPQDQLVFYDVYLNGLPFYLRVGRPIWVIWSGRSKIIMQNIYVAQKQPAPAPGYGPVLFTFEEFAKEWKEAKQPLLVFLKQRQISRLLRQGGVIPRELTRVGEFILVGNY